MNIVEQKITLVREDIKDAIIALVKETYINIHGNIPKMVKDADGDDDYFEDWRIDVRDLPEYASILVEITSDNDSYNNYERYPINEYIVNLSDDLYFYPAELGDEFYWEELSTDDLVLAYTHLLKSKDTLAR
jgi:hypothetical protein